MRETIITAFIIIAVIGGAFVSGYEYHKAEICEFQNGFEYSFDLGVCVKTEVVVVTAKSGKKR